MKKGTLAAIILIALTGFAVYANSISGDFIWDDEVLVSHNHRIKDRANLPAVFTEDIGTGGGGYYGFYRPLQMATYMADYVLWGPQAAGYHFTNILLHIMTAVCVYLLIRALFADHLLSFLTGMLFVMHPVHTEAVSYIAGRADPLAAFFMLLCLILYIKDADAKGIKVHLIIALCYICALLSRESALILPVLLVFYHMAFRKPVPVRKMTVILGIAAAYAGFRFAMPALLAANTYGSTAFLQRIPGFFVALTNYLRLLIAPFNLHMEYGRRLFSFTDIMAVLGVIILSVTLYPVFFRRGNSKLVLFSVGWFYITLLPVSNLYPVNAYMAEHWLYLPSIGFCAMLAYGMGALLKKEKTRIAAAIVTICIFLFYGYITVRQAEYWSDPIKFYTRTIKYAPSNSRLYNNLGSKYIDMGKYDEAIALFKKAIEAAPKDAYVYNNMGRAYADIGQNAEAIEAFREAIKLRPNLPQPHNNRAIIYYSEGKYKLAAEHIGIAKKFGGADKALFEDLKPYLTGE